MKMSNQRYLAKLIIGTVLGTGLAIAAIEGFNYWYWQHYFPNAYTSEQVEQLSDRELFGDAMPERLRYY